MTVTDLGLFGPSYGFNTDPASPNDYLYSDTWRSSDFGYLRFDDELFGWELRDTLYSYSYASLGLSLKGDQTSSPIGTGFAGIDPADIAGRQTQEDYRVTGDDLHVGHIDPWGTLRAGIWAEHSWQTEDRLAVDLSTGQLYDANRAFGSPVYFNFGAHLDNVSPYVEYSLKPASVWILDFGARYQRTTRDFAASVVQNFLPVRTAPSRAPRPPGCRASTRAIDWRHTPTSTHKFPKARWCRARHSFTPRLHRPATAQTLR